MTTEVWKIENNLCRCCHSEGIFMNLAVPCDYMGQKEIYTDMLRDCLAINVAPVPGALCTVTYTICDACVMRLRDACSFKQQVLDCEKQFQDMFSQNILKAADSNSHVEVKIEIPDQNSNDSRDKFDDEHNNDHHDHHDDHDDDDDDIEDTFEVNLDEDDELETLEAIKKRTERAAKRKMAEKTPTAKKRKKPARKSLNEKVSAAIAKATGVPERKRGQTETSGYYLLKQNEDGTKTFTCRTCSRTYKTLGSVSQHYRHVHLRLRPKLRSCYLCDIKVPGYARASHLEKEHGIPAPTCGACGKKFGYPFQVLRHQKIDHMGEKKFKCGVCEKSFSSNSKLETHGKIHSSVKEFKCKYCEKCFRWRKNLGTHIMMHENVRTQVCKICNAAFVQQSSLKYHMTKRHPESI